MSDLEIFYYKLLAELQKKKAERSFWTRTLLDKRKEKMYRKLEKGFCGGVNSAIVVMKKIKREFDEVYEKREMENKERTFNE